MRAQKFLIIFLTLSVTLAMADDDSKEKHTPPPSDNSHADSHTIIFDADNCVIDPAPTLDELNEYYEWMDQHDKTWRNKNERMCKMVRVIHNMRDIRAHNERFKAGLESFERALWSGSEFTFEEKMGEFVRQLPPQEPEWRQRKKPPVLLPEPVREIDYRMSGWISPPAVQGGCGSCYAWAAITPLEAQVRKCGISNETLSVQSMVDCCTQGCWGCSSGWPHWAYDWVKSTGIFTNASYPYISDQTGKEGTCKFNKADIIGHISSWLKYDFGQVGNSSYVTQMVSAYGPVATVLCVENTLFSYKTGVYKSSAPCNTPMHGVVLIGYGTDPIQGDYWIVKNSWGAGWGDNGFFKIARGSNNCFIESIVSVPFVRKLDGTPCP